MNANKKILIVDDEELNLDFFQLMLSKLGFIVEKAKDGVEAFDKVKRFLPDLVLLDNIMPRMSGWEFTKILKNDPKYQGIPIIMFSALDDVKDKIEGFELGIEDYITKPFNFSEVLARIRVVLRNRELFNQISMRETRLGLTDGIIADIKTTITVLGKSIEELTKAVTQSGANSDIVNITGQLRKNVEDLNIRIDNNLIECERLKKDEIKLPVLETDFRKSMKAEQE